MRDAFILFVIIGLGFIGANVYNTVNPPPTKLYEVAYIGTKRCPPCRVWTDVNLPVWKESFAADYVKLHKKRSLRGLMGSHPNVVEEVARRHRGIATPSFILIKDGRLVKVYRGLNGWAQLKRKLEREVQTHITMNQRLA